jgi:iron complex transport system substrate-binding protein
MSYLPTLLPNIVLQRWARLTLRVVFLCLTFASLNAAAAIRIVTVAPSLTELVYAAGAGDKLVAVSAYSDYPVEAKVLPQVADFSGINIEALLAKRPDLVLVWMSGTREADIARLTKLGIRVESIGVNQLSDVPKALRRIGVLAGATVSAEKTALQFEARLKLLNNKYRDANKISAFFEISRTPLMTIGGTHFISEVMALCGATNIFANIDQITFTPSRESLLVKNPRIILHGAKLNNDKKQKRDNAIYAGLGAASREQIFAIEADHILRPGPRLLDAAEVMCKIVDRVRLE